MAANKAVQVLDKQLGEEWRARERAVSVHSFIAVLQPVPVSYSVLWHMTSVSAPTTAGSPYGIS